MFGWPEVGFGDIAIDVLQARFWIASVLQTIRQVPGRVSRRSPLLRILSGSMKCAVAGSESPNSSSRFSAKGAILVLTPRGSVPWRCSEQQRSSNNS